MATGLSTPADIVNLALGRIGYPGRIGSLYDGSKAAKAALQFYAQTRDAVLRESTWDFAQKVAAGVTSVSTPPGQWAYEYAYPADCLMVRNVYSSSAEFADRNNPIPTTWDVGDNGGNKVIWAQVAAATLIYTAQVTDPTKWNSLFVEALAAAIGRRLTPLLVNPEFAKMAADDEKISTKMAAETDG